MKRWTQFKIIMLITAFSTVAKAQSVYFQNISDVVVGRNYDSASTIVDPANANKLLIGINSGYDTRSWANLAFLASTGGFALTSTSDSFLVDIQAPAGYGISKIIYSQNIQTYKSRVASFSSNASWTVDGVKQTISPLSAGTKTVVAQFAEARSLVKVRLDSAISATDRQYLTPTRFVRAGDASISISSPSLEVILVQLP